MRRSQSFSAAVLLAGLLAAGGAAAQTGSAAIEAPGPGGTEATGPAAPQVAEAAPVPSDAAPALFAAGALDESALAAVAGREDRPTWQSSNAQSSATVKDNRVGDNSPTGALAVSDSAFQNVSGISMVNLNTGNASSINATMNVNLSISMAPAAPGGM